MSVRLTSRTGQLSVRISFTTYDGVLHVLQYRRRGNLPYPLVEDVKEGVRHLRGTSILDSGRVNDDHTDHGP